MRAMRVWSVMAAALLAVGSCLGQAISTSAADAQKDPVLRAMLEELDRSKSQLQLQNFEKPYFIQYRLDDMDDYQAQASFGAPVGEHSARWRLVRVTVRVGNYKSDSSTERGDGSVEVATVEDDVSALRYALWAATDTAYKTALREFTQKEAARKAVQTPQQADDFSQQAAVVSLGPVLKLDLDRDAWKTVLTESSGLFKTDAELKGFEQETQYSTAQLRARVLTRYLITSEGTIVRKSAPAYQASMSAGGQAPDGMRLDRSYATAAVSASQLDSAEKFRQGTKGILLSLHELRAAPVVTDEYHGPVLFSGDAAADTFQTLFASAVGALRPEVGSQARTRGPYDSSYQARVLPDFLNVTDDPGLMEFQGRGLVGAYAIDDDGVPGQAVKVVEAGKLTHYLIGRAPVKDFPESNGHGRAGGGGPSYPQIGVLHIEPTRTVSPEELRQKLLALGKDEGLEWVYEVQTLGPGLAPRLLYRVHVADGKRELVRGAVFADLDQRTLRSGIRAAGSDTYVFNLCADVPSTILAPSLLIDDVTVKRAGNRNEKLPYYPPPD